MASLFCEHWNTKAFFFPETGISKMLFFPRKIRLAKETKSISKFSYLFLLAQRSEYYVLNIKLLFMFTIEFSTQNWMFHFFFKTNTESNVNDKNYVEETSLDAPEVFFLFCISFHCNHRTLFFFNIFDFNFW